MIACLQLIDQIDTSRTGEECILHARAQQA